MNTNMTDKLIHDGSENRRAAMNLKLARIGAILFLLGVVSFLCGLFGPVAWENTFVSGTYIFVIAGLVAFLLAGVKNLIGMVKRK